MKVLLLVSLLCAVTIDDADFVSSDGNELLSLRPTGSSTEGTAWYVQRASEDDFIAFTGKYELDDSGPMPAVRLHLSHQWYTTDDYSGGCWWQLDHDYHVNSDQRYGVYAEYDAAQHGFDLSVIRPVAIDTDGDQVSPRFSSDKFSHLIPGEVVSFRKGTIAKLEENPPPGFVPRTRWTNRIKQTDSTIYRTDLLTQDWYGWETQGQTYLVLSLEHGDRWDSGTARLLVKSVDEYGASVFWFARGRYKFYLDSDLDALLVELPMTRFYRTHWTRTLDWEANDTSREPTGLTLVVPLDDRSLREGTMTLYVGSIYYVDEEGNEERRFNDDGALFRSATERKPRSALGIEAGQTFSVRQEGFRFAGGPFAPVEKNVVSLMESSPPPGFRLRSRRQVQVVAKPILALEERPSNLNVDALRKYAADAFTRGDNRAAAEAYSELIKNDVREVHAYEMRGRCYFLMENYLAALGDYTNAINIEPSTSVLYRRASTFCELGEFHTALEDYKQAYRLDPKHAGVLNGAAWLWATCPDPTLRDGRRALVAAKKACELSNWQEPYYVDTLAAAYAEAGDFGNAIHFQELAQREFAGEVWEGGNRRLEAYRRGEPYREP